MLPNDFIAITFMYKSSIDFTISKDILTRLKNNSKNNLQIIDY